MCRWLGAPLIHVPTTSPLPGQHVVMCRVLYSTPIDRTRDVSLARCPFKSRADNKSSPRATRGYDESPQGTVSPLCKTLNLYIYIFSQKVCMIINFICFTPVSENKQDGFAEAFFLFMPRSQCAVHFKP